MPELMKTIREKGVVVAAETGSGHGGDLMRLCRMCHDIKRVGADCVKFQIRVPEAETDDKEQYRQGAEIEGMTRREFWQKVSFKPVEYMAATAEAKGQGLIVGASVCSPEGVQIAGDIDVDYIKIGSAHVIDEELVNAVMQTGKPFVVSAGIHLKKAEHMQRYGPAHIVLYGQSIYPLFRDQVVSNFNIDPDLIQEKYHTATYPPGGGYTCHSGNIYPALYAASIGACMVEVHYSDGLTGPNPDIGSSLFIHELKQLVDGIEWIRSIRHNSRNKEYWERSDKLCKETAAAMETAPRLRAIKDKGNNG